jgi:hypothetical protein
LSLYFHIAPALFLGDLLELELEDDKETKLDGCAHDGDGDDEPELDGCRLCEAVPCFSEYGEERFVP